MARNKVQFQKGLSMSEFNRLYGTEDQCHAALAKWRWPDGFACPKCAGGKYSYVATRRLYQCSSCSLQTSARAGTIFHKSRTPLPKWFLAMYMMTSAKNDVAALELSRHLDVKWDTAWLIKQKLMEVMRQRNSIYKLDGLIQVDDAYIGGEKPGKVGRGAGNKLPFVAAVETREGKPIHVQLRRFATGRRRASRRAATCCPTASPASTASSMRARCIRRPSPAAADPRICSFCG